MGSSVLMGSLNSLLLEEDFGYESCWRCLRPHHVLGREGCCCDRSAEKGIVRRCQRGSISVDTAWLRNVLFTGKTPSPSANWEPIHGCSKRCPLGECGHLLRLEECGCSSWGLWKLCHFHTSRCRMTPVFPVRRVNSSFYLLRPKHLSVFGENYSCSLVGKFLKIRSFWILNLIAEVIWFLTALFCSAWWDPT